MTQTEKILIRVLAATDAIWLPMRVFEPRELPTNTYFARRNYPMHGAGWITDDESEAERKVAQRTVARMANGELIETFRGVAGKVGSIKLTDGGEAKARAMCGLPDLGHGLGTVRDIFDLCEAFDADDQNGGLSMDAAELDGQLLAVSELTLAGIDHEDGRWTRFGEPLDTDAERKSILIFTEDMALPALNRGWVVSNSTKSGHVVYGVTTEGLKAMRGGNPFEGIDIHETESEQCLRYYGRILQNVINQLGLATPQRPGELGFLPAARCRVESLYWGKLRQKLESQTGTLCMQT
jgi:hypothetical protein